VVLTGIACGRGQHHDAGEVVEAGAPGGGFGASGADGGAPEQAGGNGGNPSSEQGGAAGASSIDGPEAAGAAGAGPVDECNIGPDVALEAPVATTSLTYTAPLDVALGQGHAFDELAREALLSKGCVTGPETNASAAFGLSGTNGVSSGSGWPLGVLSPRAHPITSLASNANVVPYNAALAEDESRSLYGIRYHSVELWPYFFQPKQRAKKEQCGDSFVQNVYPGSTMAVALKITFPSTHERDQFQRCFAPEGEDMLGQADLTPVSRYLVAHGATFTLSVLRAASEAESTQAILNGTQCSPANLPACAETLADLQQQLDELLEPPANTLPLAELPPTWGIFYYTLEAYTIFPG
jgi:hypothetical protein